MKDQFLDNWGLPKCLSNKKNWYQQLDYPLRGDWQYS